MYKKVLHKVIASYFPLIANFAEIPTVFKLCVDQVLGTVEELVPVLVHHLVDNVTVSLFVELYFFVSWEDDHYRNTNINDRDRLLGQLT